MFQIDITYILNDLIKLVAVAAGSFVTIYVKHHADLAAFKKAEAFLNSKSAAAELTRKVAGEVGKVLESPETVDKGADVVASFLKKKGVNVTQEEVKNLLSELQTDGETAEKEIKQVIAQPAEAKQPVPAQQA